jgi:peptidoglycan/xylan/chitin deacetylase (PgdA/CDA1 family)
LAKPDVLVLCYHAVSDLSGDKVMSQYGIPPDEFARQMDSLSKRGFAFIAPDEFESFMTGSGQLPSKAVLVTFDDCYEELAAVARDILQPRGIKAIAFAVSGMASGTNEWDQKIGARRLRLADTAAMKDMAAHGVEIGCHSHSHRPMPMLSDTELREETEEAAKALAALGIPRPKFFAYPYGQHDERARNAVRNAGFVAAFSVFSRRATKASDPFAVPRPEILARDAGWRFWLKTSFPHLDRLTRIRSVIVNGAIRTASAARRLARSRS